MRYNSCHAHYRQSSGNTNLYAGKVWDAVESVMPAERSHTALSVGDFVSIDGRTYRCADLGFTLVA